VWVSADDTKGVRMVDNTGGNNTVRAQLQGSTLTLGDTNDPHIQLDPNQGGVKLFNSNGDAVIQLDNAGEAFVQDQLQIGTGGEIVVQPRMYIDAGTDYTKAPSGTLEGEDTNTVLVQDGDSIVRTLTTSQPEFGHRADVTLSSGNDADGVTIIVFSASGNELLAATTVQAPSSATTTSLRYSSRGFSDHDIRVSNASGGTVDVTDTSIHSYPPVSEKNKNGTRFWTTDQTYSQFGQRTVLPGAEMLGKISGDVEGQLEARNGELYWVRSDQSETKLS